MSADLLHPPAPAMPEAERLRRRAHLLQEIADVPAPSRSRLQPTLRVSRGRTALVLVLAALIAVLAAVLPQRLARTRMTLIDQAIAAIGSSPTIHVVLQGRHAELVDLHTGKAKVLSTRSEVWSDPKLGALWVETVDGRVTREVGASRSQALSTSNWYRPFVAGYREQLRSGAFHLVGTGTIAGMPIDWIDSKPVTFRDAKTSGLLSQVTEIAISRTTYKPLYIRRRTNGAVAPGSGVRVLRAETLPRRPSLFTHQAALGVVGSTAFPGGSTGIPITLREARAAMDPDPVAPSMTLAGLHRVWIGLPDYLLPPYNSYRDQVNGLTLYYGHLDDTGHPSYEGSYITITEVPRRTVAATLWGGPGLFRNDGAVLTSDTAAHENTATLRAHGLYVMIQATSRTSAIDAVRALAR
jgi:hypothetical protein